MSSMPSDSAPPSSPTRLPSLKPTLAFDPRILPGVPKGTLVLPREDLGPRLDAGQTVALSPEEIRAIEADGPMAVAPPTLPPASNERRWLPAVLLGLGVLAMVVLAPFGALRLSLARSRSYVAPMVLSKSDVRVVEVASARERELSRKSELAARKEATLARIQELDRAQALEASFRSSFEAALRSDLDDRRAQLRQLQKLVAEHEASAEAEAGTKRLDLEAKLARARQRIALLEAALPNGRASGYRALSLRHEYDRSRLETERAEAEKRSLESALEAADAATARSESLLATIDGSPFRLAIEQDATLGFVPYDNVANVGAGATVSTCRMGAWLCTAVGTVDAILPGEVNGTNPVTGRPDRGKLVRLLLTKPEAATRSMLFASSSPEGGRPPSSTDSR
jgi:hypothetical protein